MSDESRRSLTVGSRWRWSYSGEVVVIVAISGKYVRVRFESDTRRPTGFLREIIEEQIRRGVLVEVE